MLAIVLYAPVRDTLKESKIYVKLSDKLFQGLFISLMHAFVTKEGKQIVVSPHLLFKQYMIMSYIDSLTWDQIWLNARGLSKVTRQTIVWRRSENKSLVKFAEQIPTVTNCDK